MGFKAAKAKNLASVYFGRLTQLNIYNKYLVSDKLIAFYVTLCHI